MFGNFLKNVENSFRKNRVSKKSAHYAGSNAQWMQANVFIASKDNKIYPKTHHI